MESRKFIGSRTKKNVLHGKKVLKESDGGDNFADYFTDSENETTMSTVTHENSDILDTPKVAGISTAKSRTLRQSVRKSRNSKLIHSQAGTIDKLPVVKNNLSSVKGINRSRFRKQKLGSRTQRNVLHGKIIRKESDGGDNFADYFTDSENETTMSTVTHENSDTIDKSKISRSSNAKSGTLRQNTRKSQISKLSHSQTGIVDKLPESKHTRSPLKSIKNSILSSEKDSNSSPNRRKIFSKSKHRIHCSAGNLSNSSAVLDSSRSNDEDESNALSGSFQHSTSVTRGQSKSPCIHSSPKTNKRVEHSAITASEMKELIDSLFYKSSSSRFEKTFTLQKNDQNANRDSTYITSKVIHDATDSVDVADLKIQLLPDRSLNEGNDIVLDRSQVSNTYLTPLGNCIVKKLSSIKSKLSEKYDKYDAEIMQMAKNQNINIDEIDDEAVLTHEKKKQVNETFTAVKSHKNVSWKDIESATDIPEREGENFPIPQNKRKKSLHETGEIHEEENKTTLYLGSRKEKLKNSDSSHRLKNRSKSAEILEEENRNTQRSRKILNQIDDEIHEEKNENSRSFQNKKRKSFDKTNEKFKNSDSFLIDKSIIVEEKNRNTCSPQKSKKPLNKIDDEILEAENEISGNLRNKKKKSVDKTNEKLNSESFLVDKSIITEERNKNTRSPQKSKKPLNKINDEILEAENKISGSLRNKKKKSVDKTNKKLNSESFLVDKSIITKERNRNTRRPQKRKRLLNKTDELIHEKENETSRSLQKKKEKSVEKTNALSKGSESLQEEKRKISEIDEEENIINQRLHSKRIKLVNEESEAVSHRDENEQLEVSPRKKVKKAAGCKANNSEPVRKSVRRRFSPLAAWRNERLLYRCDKGNNTLIGLDKGTKEDNRAVLQLMAKMFRTPVEKEKKKKLKRINVFDIVTKRNFKLCLVKDFNNVPWEENFERDKCPYRIKRPFQTDNAGFGFIEIDVNGEKPAQYMPENDIFLIVLNGNVEVTIDKYNLKVNEKGTFIVPRCVPYSLKNIGTKKALLSFSIGKFHAMQMLIQKEKL